MSGLLVSIPCLVVTDGAYASVRLEVASLFDTSEGEHVLRMGVGPRTVQLTLGEGMILREALDTWINSFVQ